MPDSAFVQTRIWGKSAKDSAALEAEAMRWSKSGSIATPKDGRGKRPPDIDIMTFESGSWHQRSMQEMHTKEARDAWRKQMRQRTKDQRKRYQSLIGTKRKPPNRRSDYIHGIISFSPEAITKISDKDLTDRARAYVDWLSKQLDVEPIFIVLHKDETTRHFHFMLENTMGHMRSSPKKRGQAKDKTCTATTMIGKNECSKLQDHVGQVFADLGLRRGISKTLTRARYRDLHELHKARFAQNLGEIAAQNAKLKQLRTDTQEAQDRAESAKNYAESAQRMASLTLSKAKADSKQIFNKWYDYENQKITRKINEKQRTLQRAQGNLKALGGAAALSRKLDLYEAYIEDRGLAQDFEDWSAAYLQAQQKREDEAIDYETNLDLEAEHLAEQFSLYEDEPER